MLLCFYRRPCDLLLDGIRWRGITGFKTEPKPAILQVSKVWIAGSSVAEISFRVHCFVKFCFYAKKLSLYLLFVSFFDMHRSLGNLFQRKSWSSSNRGCFSLSPSTSMLQFPFCSIYSGLRGSTKCFKSTQNLVLCSDSGGC